MTNQESSYGAGSGSGSRRPWATAFSNDVRMSPRRPDAALTRTRARRQDVIDGLSHGYLAAAFALGVRPLARAPDGSGRRGPLAVDAGPDALHA